MSDVWHSSEYRSVSTQFPFLKARRKATVEMVAAMAHMVTALNYPVVVVAYTVLGSNPQVRTVVMVFQLLRDVI